MNTEFDLTELLKTLPGSVYWKNCDGVYFGCNDYMLQMVGLESLQEIIGKTDYDLPWKKQAGALRKIDQKVIKTGKEITVEESGELINGKLAIYLTTKKPLRNKKQEIIGVFGVSVDITSYKETELALKKANAKINSAIKEKQEFLAKMSEDVMGPSADKRPKSLEDYVTGMRNYLENIIACMPVNVWWVDKNGTCLSCNDNVVKMVGLKSRAEYTGKTYYDLARIGNWVDGEADSFAQDDIKVIASGVPMLNVEGPPLPGPDGKLIHYITSRVPLFDEQGNVISVVGVATDITERKKMEWELKESKEKAESANRAKTEFLSQSVSDLNKPLDHLRNFIKEKIKSTKIHKIKQEFEYVLQTCGTLQSVVGDIKNFANYDLNIEHAELKPFVKSKKTTKKVIGEIKDDLLVAHNFFGVSKRESHCLYYLMRGMTGKQIAKTLKLSPRTVEFYLENAKLKLKCQNRHELINKMFEAGLV